MVESIIQLKCFCNSYPWGKQGSESLAATLCEKTPGTDFKLEEDKPYAEMWMGTYPELPSYVLSTGEDLQDVLDKNADQLIGQNVVKKFGHSKLPFLPKVLSIAKALPLQVHPNKELSAELHKKDPKSFTDPNHKPEIALALGPFEAFVGFKPLADIEPILSLDPLKQFLPSGSFTDASLKHAVESILKASPETIAKAQSSLVSLPASSFGQQTYIQEMIPRLQSQYEETDPGTLIALLTMNYLQLSAGDSIYIPADGIHAYLSGDIIECMARSNNVLNTGFCPAAERDNIDTFMSTLTFAPHSADECILKSTPWDHASGGFTSVYKPPMSEFNQLALQLPRKKSESWDALGGPGILIVTRGAGKMEGGGKVYDVSEGHIYFVGQGTKVRFQASDDVEAYMSYVE